MTLIKVYIISRVIYKDKQGDSMAHCENCGTKMSNGYCTNCHEEAYIMDFESEYMDRQPCDEFQALADKQRKEIREMNRTRRLEQKCEMDEYKDKQ